MLDDLQPLWPHEVAPARVRLWELLAMQALLGIGVAVTASLSRDYYSPRLTWLIALANSASLSLAVLVLRDATLGASARFARPGRVALGICGCLAVAVFAEGVSAGKWWPRFPIHSGCMLLLSPAAVGLGVVNAWISFRRRPLWSLVPLACAVAQAAGTILRM